MLNLIPRFYDATEGAVRIDGVDIRDITQENLREQIGYVPQKGVLFSGSIASNLQYGKEDASYDEMVEAAETAQAMEFIQTKENGLDEEVSQGGTNVSGGQKQRLSIARALVKKSESLSVRRQLLGTGLQDGSGAAKGFERESGR